MLLGIGCSEQLGVVKQVDLRAPEFGPPPSELAGAALEMTEWGEREGCLAALVSEHHGSPDGYLPSPLLLASAGLGSGRTGLWLAAFLIQYLGLLAERWFFFAQANHPQNLYYQTV